MDDLIEIDLIEESGFRPIFKWRERKIKNYQQPEGEDGKILEEGKHLTEEFPIFNNQLAKIQLTLQTILASINCVCENRKLYLKIHPHFGDLLVKC